MRSEVVDQPREGAVEQAIALVTNNLPAYRALWRKCRHVGSRLLVLDDFVFAADRTDDVVIHRLEDIACSPVGRRLAIVHILGLCHSCRFLTRAAIVTDSAARDWSGRHSCLCIARDPPGFKIVRNRESGSHKMSAVLAWSKRDQSHAYASHQRRGGASGGRRVAWRDNAARVANHGGGGLRPRSSVFETPHTRVIGRAAISMFRRIRCRHGCRVLPRLAGRSRC